MRVSCVKSLVADHSDGVTIAVVREIFRNSV